MVRQAFATLRRPEAKLIMRFQGQQKMPMGYENVTYVQGESDTVAWRSIYSVGDVYLGLSRQEGTGLSSWNSTFVVTDLTSSLQHAITRT